MADGSRMPSSLTPSGGASSSIQTTSGAVYNMSSSSLFSAVTSTSPAKMDKQATESFLGMFGHAMFFLVKLVPGVLYWLITFTTITLPSCLFSLFSTTLTFTMNATTL